MNRMRKIEEISNRRFLSLEHPKKDNNIKCASINTNNSTNNSTNTLNNNFKLLYNLFIFMFIHFCKEY